MKKLIMAVAIVCVAVVSQAATYYWTAKSEDVWQPGANYGLSGEFVPVDTPAYVFLLTESFTQEDVLTAVRKGTELSDMSFHKELAVGADGRIVEEGMTTTVANEGDKSYFFFAMQYGDQLLLTDKKGGIGSTVAENPTSARFETEYASGDNGTLYGDKTWASSGAEGNGGGYFTTAVPEPTSGLLLLLGVAGLALKRRRA